MSYDLLANSSPIGDQSLTESETESLKHSMRSHMKYGSTGTDYKGVNRYRYITHLIQPTDTLQGLAVKYEVTVEQIKRANNLWSNDNLWLRSRTHISIPVVINTETNIESPLYSSSNTSSLTTSPKEIISNSIPMTTNNSSLDSVDIPLDDNESNSSRLDANQMSQNSRKNDHKLKNGFKTLVSSDGQTHDLDSYCNNGNADESAADFLIRIDSSIAKTKDKVKDMQQNRLIGTHSDDDLFRFNHNTDRSALRRHHSSTSRPHSANSSANSNHSDFPQPLVMMSHKRKVKSSLKRLEQTQDEIFEL
ncbi:lysM and putative peptidoglycan-binding domain-containing protein 2-like [Oppia nitens]|uniref:lysM and putative peptidoglycan-binding domain-containing protein 2-like n=1 Tax=Oppia nitens TaxID=1686743 RepID=UPI0023DC46A7|nr:lysM and putative peptidoglycan-binding domain-containing protein 2-like [Oppia nitens]